MLRLIRDDYNDQHTIGKMYCDGLFLGYTLEDTVRAQGVKVQNETAIAAGRYRVRMTWSNRFKKIMPELMNVPMFAGVRIHGGNTEHDTEGCILLGSNRNSERIYNCASALGRLYQIISEEERKREVWLEITEERGVA